MHHIIEGIARAMHVSAWADQEEEKGRTYPGEELMDVAPKTPRKAKDQAWRLVGMFEALNDLNMPAIFIRACVADKLTTYEAESWEDMYIEHGETFGHYLAMRALGTGVGWEDNHAESGIVYPHFEYWG